MKYDGYQFVVKSCEDLTDPENNLYTITGDGDKYIVSWEIEGRKHKSNYGTKSVEDFFKKGAWRIVNILKKEVKTKDGSRNLFNMDDL